MLKREALKGGLGPDVINSIAARRHPEGMDDRQQALFDCVTERLDSRTIGELTHARATVVLGQQSVVELVGLLGFYTVVPMTLNSFSIGLPMGEAPELSR